MQYRVQHWHPDAMLYVVDARQALHFKNLFAAARRAGFDKVASRALSVRLRARGGSPADQDARRRGSRAGSTAWMKPSNGPGPAYENSRKERLERGEELPELSAEERDRIAQVVGIGAVKYADLSQNRTSDYVFSWDKMLAMDGNTATYMQYAYARVRSIFRKGNEIRDDFTVESARCPFWKIPASAGWHSSSCGLPDVLLAAAADFKPNVITGYLWDLAKAYSGFFQNCPVLKAATPELRRSRLLMSDLAARTIKLCLELLGIGTIEQM